MQYEDRQYQIDATERTVSFLLAQARSKKPRNGIVYLPTGSGKSLCIGRSSVELARHPQGAPVIVTQPSKEILIQNKRKIEEYGFRCGVMSASMGRKDLGDVTLCTIGTVFKHPEWFEDFGFGMNDECFVGGTRIDGRPIETITPGQTVRAFDHARQLVVRARVVAVSRRPAPEHLCCVQLQGESIISTPNHPYFVIGRGYVAAHTIRVGDTVIAAGMEPSSTEPSSDPALHILWETRHLEGHRTLVSLAEDWTRLPQRMRSQARCAEFIGQDESSQSDVQYGNAPQNGENAQADWPQADSKGREWHSYAETTANGLGRFGARLVSRVGCANSLQPRIEVPLLLQNRYSQPGLIDRSGDRRGEPSWQAASDRRKENSVLGIARVESVEIFKQRSPHGSTARPYYHHVYNLQVKDHSNYFANGILVHNCHLAGAKDNSKIVIADDEGFYHREFGLCRPLRNQEGVPKSKVAVMTEDDGPQIIPRPKKGMYKTFMEALPHIAWAGWTASPYRRVSDQWGTQLHMITRTRPALFQDFIHYTQNRELFDAGYLAKLEYYPVRGFKPSQVTMNSAGAEYDSESLQLHLFERNWETKAGTKVDFKDKLTETLERLLMAGRKRIIVFTSSIAESEHLAEQLKGECSVVTGETLDDERDAAVESFRSGDIPVIANVACFIHGLDVPEIDCVVDASPTLSLSRWYQKLGRAVRTHPQKESAWIIDMVEGYKSFGRVEDLTLYLDGQRRWNIYGRPGGGPEKVLTHTYLAGGTRGLCVKCGKAKTMAFYPKTNKWLPLSPGRGNVMIDLQGTKKVCRFVERGAGDFLFHSIVCKKKEQAV